jgi:hypothetical protein
MIRHQAVFIDIKASFLAKVEQAVERGRSKVLVDENSSTVESDKGYEVYLSKGIIEAR